MSRKTEVVVKPVHVVMAVLAFVLLAVGFYAVAPVISAAAKSSGPQEAAAREGAMAFLNRDVRQGKQAWIDSVCAVSTENGCELMSEVFAPLAWPSTEELNQVVVCGIDSAARHMSFTLTQDAESLEAEVWKLSGSCMINDAVAPKSGEVFVAVVKDGDGWKFDHVVFDQELKALEGK